jgi:pimeloyl-ACP methyl ester carboxylesterase
MRDVEVVSDGERMRYVEFPGRASACVFLHGLGASSPAYFARVAADPALAGRRRLMPDFLGFGLSDRPARFGYGLRDHALCLARALDALGVSEADVVGHSMGGAIAIILASQRPDLVRRLVLAEPSLTPSRRTRVEGHTEESFAGVGLAEALAAVGPHWAATMRLADPLALYRGERALGDAMEPGIAEMLLGLSLPRTLIMGDRTPISAAGQTMVAAGIPLIRIAHAGHNMMLDNPTEFVAALVKVLR